jgi:hypothetical protein
VSSKVPRFVLSYARQDRDNFLEKFYRDVRKIVADREALSNEPEDPEPGFRDVNDIPNGADWSEELAKALQNGWACLSLFSPRYFGREYCGKEFQVFLERAGVTYDADGAAINPKGIFPVMWGRSDDLKNKGFPPAVANRINRRVRPKHQAAYEKFGLLGIMMRGPRSAAYRDILQDLTDDLIAGFRNPPAPAPKRPNLNEVANAFGAGRVRTSSGATDAGPSHAQLFLLTNEQDGDAWSSTRADEWQEKCEATRPMLELSVHSVEPNPSSAPALIARLTEASQKNQLLLVAVPTRGAVLPLGTVELLRAVVASEHWTGLVLMASDASDAPLLTVPEPNVARILVSTMPDDAAKFGDELASRYLHRALELLVRQGTVQQRPPGGGAPGEKPKITGPIGGGSNG